MAGVTEKKRIFSRAPIMVYQSTFQKRQEEVLLGLAEDDESRLVVQYKVTLRIWPSKGFL